jgi:hypothetical protein
MALQTPSRSDEERLISAFGALPQLAMTPDTVGSVTSFLTGDDRGQGPLLTSIAEAAQNGTLPPTRKVTSKSTFLAAMDETQNPMMAAMAAEEEARLDILAKAHAASMKAAASPENRVAMAAQSYFTNYPEALYADGGPTPEFAKSFGVPTKALDDAVSDMKIQPGLLTEGIGFQGNGNIPPSVIKAMEEAAPSGGSVNDGMNGEMNGIGDETTDGEAVSEEMIEEARERLKELRRLLESPGGYTNTLYLETISAAADLYLLLYPELGPGLAGGHAKSLVDGWGTALAGGGANGAGEEGADKPEGTSLSILAEASQGIDQASWGTAPRTLPTVAYYSLEDQYQAVAGPQIGPMRNRPAGQAALKAGYLPAFGRFLLTAVLSIRLPKKKGGQPELWNPRFDRKDEWFYEWGEENFNTPVSEAERRTMYSNWYELVRASKGERFSTPQDEKVARHYQQVARNINWQIAAAMAIAGLGGSGSMGVRGRIKKEYFGRLLDRYGREMGGRPQEEYVGLAAWLSNIKGSRWALTAARYGSERDITEEEMGDFGTGEGDEEAFLEDFDEWGGTEAGKERKKKKDEEEAEAVSEKERVAAEAARAKQDAAIEDATAEAARQRAAGFGMSEDLAGPAGLLPPDYYEGVTDWGTLGSSRVAPPAGMDETQNPMMAAMAAPLIADQSMPFLTSGLRPPQPDEMVGLNPLLSGIAPPAPEEEMMNLLAGQITLPPIYEGSGMPVIRRAPPPVATPIPAGIIDPFSNWV